MKKRVFRIAFALSAALALLCLCSCGDSPNANFYWLITPFAWIIRQFSSWFNGIYVLALLLFAILIKILFLPLSIRQQKNQVKGAKLRPQIALIQKKYAGRTDQDSQMKMRQELQEMQQREGYSPMAGCLPMLIQLVVVIVLYGVIRNPLTYLAQMNNKTVAEAYNVAYDINPDLYAIKGRDKFEFNENGEILSADAWNDVKAIDQFKLIAAYRANPEAFADIDLFVANADKIPDLTMGKHIDLSQTPSLRFWSVGVSGWLLLIPLFNLGLAVMTTLLTKKLNGNLQAELAGQTPDQQKSSALMEWMMPIMSFAFTFMFQAILGVYWIFQSGLAIVQMLILHKIWPMPTFTEEEIREYKKKLNERPKAASDPDRPRPRSLHHIDDDDDDVPSPAAKQAEGRNPNTSKKKAQQSDERQRQIEREAAREAREQRKAEAARPKAENETAEQDETTAGDVSEAAQAQPAKDDEAIGYVAYQTETSDDADADESAPDKARDEK